MKRRDVLRSFAGVTGIGATAGAQVGVGPRTPISVEAVGELMRLHGLEPRPGEALQVRAFLSSTGARARTIPDPRIEPAIRLDPHLE